ncbi:hypothetical protein AMELA_G00296140 [Ameiurus melas]|uniref:Uncharacterized protein n=1 Tax=Ameiurus melas TaxID=219545 RepID=A0A7J5ZHS7_AMEME|nr:hypothetical protein AMELA_G00296140 [Ameiurus melas]
MRLLHFCRSLGIIWNEAPETQNPEVCKRGILTSASGSVLCNVFMQYVPCNITATYLRCIFKIENKCPYQESLSTYDSLIKI